MRWRGILIAALVLLFIGGGFFASFFIELAWWNELHQLETFWTKFYLVSGPRAAAVLVTFVALWITHARALKAAGTGLGERPGYFRISTIVLLLVSFFLGSVLIDAPTVIQYFAGAHTPDPSGYQDAAFGQSLSFYVFELPFYQMLAGTLLFLCLLLVLVYVVVSRWWSLFTQDQLDPRHVVNIDIAAVFNFRTLGANGTVRFFIAMALLCLAVRAWLSRFDLVYADHGFITGFDYISQMVTNPLLLLATFAIVAGAILALMGRLKLAALAALTLLLPGVVPGLVGIFVKPNEITLQRPYIERHLAATREAFAVASQVKVVNYAVKPQTAVDIAGYRNQLDNVRLWDWRAFHDAVAQLQTLRQYYVFAETDVDRYRLGGQLKQVMVTARELDINQLPEASRRWLNPNLIYTHGYGLVVADASRITPDGQPLMYVKDAPPKIETPELKLTRPELYFGEQTHEPVFVNTAQEEFNYPEGERNIHSRYAGLGGIPMGDLFLRLAATWNYLDRNILLTNYFTKDTRMLIHRNIRERLETLAPFLSWDSDPYPVITKAGRMVWIVDGYTHTDRYPNSRLLNSAKLGRMNYLRNSVKATVDAYDGTTVLYVAEPKDPLVLAWQHLFPKLFRPLTELSADLHEHLRHPELMFSIQGEIYRTYHMRVADTFYNKEDLWEVGKSISGQETEPEPMPPFYLIATLPGEKAPEFLVSLAFTPQRRPNLTAMMFARCDEPHRGEIVVYEFSKQEQLFGPIQIEARINQDQNISKDLTLWNQQGSSVLRGQMVILPIDNTLIYIKPLYLQAAQARMPQLKKIVISTAAAQTLVYEDTYAQALARLSGSNDASAPQTADSFSAVAAALPDLDPNRILRDIAKRLSNYRRLTGEGKYSEAARELEALDSLAKDGTAKQNPAGKIK